MRILGMLLLVAGVSLAASFGARNGDSHSEYRRAIGMVGHLQGIVEAGNAEVNQAKEDGDMIALKVAKKKVTAAISVRDDAQAELDALVLPEPRQRLMEWLQVGGIGWGGGTVLIAAGAFLARREQAAAASGATGDTRADFPSTVRKALEVIEAVDAEIADLPMDQTAPKARDAIDDLHDGHLAPLVDARGQLVARHGLSAFALYFGPFSGGERNLARVWSALTDGHVVEARRALGRSRAEFSNALVAWEKAEADA